MTVFTIYGNSNDSDTFFCDGVAKKIVAKVATRSEEKSEDIQIRFTVETEINFLVRLEELKKAHDGLLSHTSSNIVFRDDVYVGDLSAFQRLAITEYGVEDAEYGNNVLFSRLVKEETNRIMKATGRKYVHIEFQDGSAKRTAKSPQYGVLIFELFDHLCPLGCENFIQLCTGDQGIDETYNVPYHYFNCPIHRLVKGGWLQCGDIVDGSGAHSLAAIQTPPSYLSLPEETKSSSSSSFSSYSSDSKDQQEPSSSSSSSSSSSPSTITSQQINKLPDECFSVDFGFPLGGILGYANTGPHTNGSQFLITLGPCSWMNTRFEGIGRVIYGNSILKLMNDSAMTSNQRPVPPIKIVNCGIQC